MLFGLPSACLAFAARAASQGSEDEFCFAAGDDAAKWPGESARKWKQKARGFNDKSLRRLAAALGVGKTQFHPADELKKVCERAAN